MIIVGQAPGKGKDGTLQGRCGRKLTQVLGHDINEHVLINLLHYYPGKVGKGDRFPMEEGRIAARKLRPHLAGSTVVLLGRNVAKAFGLAKLPYMVLKTVISTTFVVIPHPSGINRWWNDPNNVRQVEEFFYGPKP